MSSIFSVSTFLHIMYIIPCTNTPFIGRGIQYTEGCIPELGTLQRKKYDISRGEGYILQKAENYRPKSVYLMGCIHCPERNKLRETENSLQRGVGKVYA